MNNELAVTWHPTVTCLHPVLLIASGERIGRGVIVRLALEEATLRTRMPLEAGEMLVMAGDFDDRSAKIACAVGELDGDMVTVRYAASDAESRAAIARYLFTRLRKDVPPPHLTPRANPNIEMSQRKPHVTWVPKVKDVDRHQEVGEKWIDKQLIPPTPVIAPRR